MARNRRKLVAIIVHSKKALQQQQQQQQQHFLKIKKTEVKNYRAIKYAISRLYSFYL
jgi:hypothetical protein